MKKWLWMTMSCCLFSCAGHNNVAFTARLELAVAYLAVDDLASAYENIKIAENYAPDDFRLQLVLVEYEQKAGYYAGAEQRMSRLLVQYPDNAIIRNNYGVLLCRSGQYNKAIQQFKQVFSAADYSVVAEGFAQAGLCALSFKHFDDARFYFSRMYHLDKYKSQNLLDKARNSDLLAAGFLRDVFQQSEGEGMAGG